MIIGGIDNNRPVKEWSSEKLERMLPKLQSLASGQMSAGNYEKAKELSDKANEVIAEIGRRRNQFEPKTAKMAFSQESRKKNEPETPELIKLINQKSAEQIRYLQSCSRNCSTEEAASILADRVEIRFQQLKNLGFPDEPAKERALFDALEIDHGLAMHVWPKLDATADYTERSGILKNTADRLAELKVSLEEEERKMKGEGYYPIYEVHQRYSINSPALWLNPAVKKQWLDQLQSAGLVKVENFFRHTQMWCLTEYAWDYLWYGSEDAGVFERALYVKPGKLEELRALLGEPNDVGKGAPASIIPMAQKSDEDVIDEILNLKEISRAELNGLPWKDRRYKEIESEKLDEMHEKFMADAHAARLAGNEELASSHMNNVGDVNSELMIRRQIQIQRASENPIDLADPADEGRLKYLLEEKMKNYLYKVQADEMEFNYQNVVNNRVSELQRKYSDLGHAESDAILRAKCELIGVKLKS